MFLIFSGVYERAETHGRQTLLRSRANQIADYEALHHIHIWNIEPEPEYIYYIGQSKNFEDWYDMRKGDQNAIYKGFEEKSTFRNGFLMKRIMIYFQFGYIKKIKLREKLKRLKI